jgi:quercetin 2,3-dioxygenase
MKDEVIIYKAENRTTVKNDIVQYCTLLKDNLSNNNCASFRHLLYVDDIFLQPKQVIELTKFDNCQLLILPIIGGIEINNCISFIGAEQFYWKPINKKTTIVNPYEANEVNCLLLGFNYKEPNLMHDYFGEIDFSTKNILHPFLNLPHLKMLIGIFKGRQEYTYETKYSNTGIYCMVIKGVVEVNGRLLHPRDGLSFSKVKDIELEALADNSIILFIETT